MGGYRSAGKYKKLAFVGGGGVERTLQRAVQVSVSNMLM